MTASMDISRAVIEYDSNANIGSIVHHMGHSWVPLRSYGTGYRPFEWQTAPIIETIWLNEGFATWSEAIWYEFEGGYDDYLDEIQSTGENKTYLPGVEMPPSCWFCL